MMECTSHYCYDIYLLSIAISAPILVVNPVFASTINIHMYKYTDNRKGVGSSHFHNVK